jgi:hypothetical protein
MATATRWRLGGWLRPAIVVGALAAALVGCDLGPPPAAPEPPYPEGQQPPPEIPHPPPPQMLDTAPAPGGDDVAVDDFVAPLGNYGTWVDVPPYGRAWQPADDQAGEGFTPYASDGSWAANDDGSWVYQSRNDSTWGWATYHYGRWVDHGDYGWVWVPGTVWAPSWVEWRYGGGYVGWVPMGPPGVAFGESRWVFVGEQNFGAPAVWGYRLPPDQVHVAFAAAMPIVEVRGSAHWTAGPSVARLAAAGVAVRSVHVAMPARGYVRAQAAAVVRVAATTRAGRVQAAPVVRRGPSAVRVQAQPVPAPAPVPRPVERPAVPAPAPRPIERQAAPAPAPAPRQVAPVQHPVAPAPRRRPPPPPPKLHK